MPPPRLPVRGRARRPVRQVRQARQRGRAGAAALQGVHAPALRAPQRATVHRAGAGEVAVD